MRKVSYLDALGQVTRRIDPLGRVVSNVYDGQSRLISTTLPEGNRLEYTYDDAPCLTQKRCTHNVKTVSQVAKPGSGLATLTRRFTYEPNFNQVASATDPRGLVTNYTYTGSGLPLTVTSPAVTTLWDSVALSPETTVSYSAFSPAGFPTFSLPTGTTAKIRGGVTVVNSTVFDAANHYVPLRTIVDSGSGALNLTTTFTYDGVGNLTRVDGPRSDVADVTQFAYDAERRLLQTTDALGKVTQYGYDADGRPTRRASQIGSQWLVRCQTYSASGQTLKAWGPAQTAAATTCPSAAAPVAVTDYHYDALDRLDQVTENLPAAEGGNRVTQTTYDADDRVQRIQRAVGTALAQTDTTLTTTANGRPATRADARGNLTTSLYDGHDRLIETRYPDKTTAGVSSTSDREQYAYDDNGNLTTLTRRDGQRVTLAYDNLDRLISRRTPNSADDVHFTYDLLGRRTSANHAHFALDFRWDNAGRLTDTAAGGQTGQYTLSGHN